MANKVHSDLYVRFAQQVLDERIRQELTEWFQSSNEVKIFITGRTGVGKSTLVNGLVGEQMAKEGDSLDPETSEVKAWGSEYRSIQVTVWDSPGLQDGTNQESSYLDDMREKCSDMDLSIYCVSFKETRFFKGCADIVAMTKLTQVFGERMWKNAMFVLTFANLAEDLDSRILEADDDEERIRLFQEKLRLWKETLTDALINDVGVDKAIARRIQVVPAGHASIPELIDRPQWLSPIWFTALYAMNSRAQPAMVKLNYHRIVDKPDEIRDEDLKNFIEKQPLIFSQRGELIGEKFGASGRGKVIGSMLGDDTSAEIQMALELYSNM